MNKIGVLGTGQIGNTIASRLIKLGYEVKMGSRTANNHKALDWVKENGTKASTGTFADAVEFGNIIFNCTKGEITLSVFTMVGLDKFTDKTIIDVTNSLLHSDTDFPYTLLSEYINTTSIAEEIQKLLPKAKVVKSLNIVNSELMANGEKAPAGTTMMLCGNDIKAKQEVISILTQFGWKDMLDLGNIEGARAMEMFAPMWMYVVKATNNVNWTLTVNR